jgi:hypothetical protein
MRPRLAWLALTALPMALTPRLARAQETGPIVAVFDIDDRTKALEESAAKDLGDYLAVLLTQGGWQVVPRDQLRARLKEAQGESYKACYDQSCQVELGRELAAQKTLSTQIFKLGNQCRVTATLYDLKRAATEKAESAKSECDPEKLGLALEEIAGKITRKLDQADLEKARQDQETKLAADRKAVEDEAARQQSLEEEAAKVKAQEDQAARQKAADAEAASKTAREDEAAKPAAPEEMEAKNDGWHTAILGVNLGVLTSGLGGDSGIALDKQGFKAYLTNDPGLFLDLGCDFPLLRYFSLGLAVDFLHADTVQDLYSGGSRKGALDYMAFALRVKGRLPIADVVELRLGVTAGAGLLLNIPTLEVTDGTAAGFDMPIKSGFAGAYVAAQLEVSWWVTRSLGLVAAFGVMAQPTGPIDGPDPWDHTNPDKQVTYDMVIPARITFTLGVELGL